VAEAQRSTVKHCSKRRRPAAPSSPRQLLVFEQRTARLCEPVGMRRRIDQEALDALLNDLRDAADARRHDRRARRHRLQHDRR